MPPSSVAKRTVGFGGVVKAPQAPHNLTLKGPCATKDPRYSNVTWRGSSGFCQENLQNVKNTSCYAIFNGALHNFFVKFEINSFKERYWDTLLQHHLGNDGHFVDGHPILHQLEQFQQSMGGQGASRCCSLGYLFLKHWHLISQSAHVEV